MIRCRNYQGDWFIWKCFVNLVPTRVRVSAQFAILWKLCSMCSEDMLCTQFISYFVSTRCKYSTVITNIDFLYLVNAILFTFCQFSTFELTRRVCDINGVITPAITELL